MLSQAEYASSVGHRVAREFDYRFVKQQAPGMQLVISLSSAARLSCMKIPSAN
jgi:hypothetical protein